MEAAGAYSTDGDTNPIVIDAGYLNALVQSSFEED